MTNDKDWFILLQMADSAFPVGGFAYSSGLESAVKSGLIADQDMLREYLITFSQQILSFDFPFICSAFGLPWSVDEPGKIVMLLGAYQAMLLNPPLRKAVGVVGKNWMRICSQLSDSCRLQELQHVLNVEEISFDFPVVFGLSMNALEYTLSQSLYLYFYMSLRDQVSALIRLGVAGPSRAHMELQDILKSFAYRISDYIPVSYEKASKSAYLLELAQLSHERVYSKLFQN